MRYFYRFNHFPDVIVSDTIKKLYAATLDPDILFSYFGSKIVNGLHDANINGLRFPKPPDEFNHYGYDIRTLCYKPIFKEISKESYDRIFKDEKRILKKEMTIRAGLKAWHTPIKTSIKGDNEVKKWLNNKFNLDINEIKLV